MFRKEPAGRFALGHVFHFTPVPEADTAVDFADAGSWSCDLTDGDSLTWSDKVYELFGIAKGSNVERDQAVARYKEPSKSVLERVRTFAVSHACGFILDAAIRQDEGSDQWIRVIAFPVVEDDRVVGLRGFKRAL